VAIRFNLAYTWCPMTGSELPSNMRDFNEITAVIFARLFKAFPVPLTLNPDEIAGVLGLTDRQQVMPSGRAFYEVLNHTVQWLIKEDFVRSQGHFPVERMVLTTKGMAALNIVPPSLNRPLGSEIAEATKEASTEGGKTKIAELMSDFFGFLLGSFTKSISGS
jgi:hypothetical protein